MINKETPKEKQARLLRDLMKSNKPSYPPAQKSHLVEMEGEIIEKMKEKMKEELNIPEIKYTRTSNLFSLCSPSKIMWKIYNKSAGTLDCSCCIFWRGFILCLLSVGWLSITGVIGALIYLK